MQHPWDRTGPLDVRLPTRLGIGWPILLGVLALLVAPADSYLVELLNPDQPIGWLDTAAAFLDQWSTRIELLVLLSFFFLSLIVRRLMEHTKALSAFALTWVLCEIVVGTLKRTTGRPRPVHPDGMQDQLRILFENMDLKSFPSGHTAMAVAVALFVSVWRPRSWYVPVIWGAALLIGLGRIYIGAHHPSDVLAGAAIGWLMAAIAWKAVTPGVGLFRPLYPPRVVAPLVILAWAIVGGWLLQDPIEIRDAVSGLSLDDWKLPQNSLRTLVLEPFAGPARKIASLPDLTSFILWGCAWACVVAGGALAIWRRAALWWMLSLLLLGGLWGLLAVSGGPGWDGAPQRPQRASVAGPWVAFDAQSHLDDPFDGAVSLERGLERFRRLGYEAVIPTHHDSWSQAWLLGASGDWEKMDLWGMEWSGGDPATRPLHLLIYNQRPEPRELNRINDYQEVIRLVHEAGGVVVASHFWRGDAGQLPSSAALLAAGIDGFEVAGRNEESREEPLRRLQEIRDLVQRHELLGLGSSDFHGRRAFNQAWNFTTSADGETAASPTRGVWEALSERGCRPLVVSLHSDPVPGMLAPGQAAVSYLREMSLAARVSWLVWLTLISALFWRRERARTAARAIR